MTFLFSFAAARSCHLPEKQRFFATVAAVAAVAGLAAGSSVALASPPAAISAEQKQQRKQVFDLVWGRVKERHFDPTLGGVDWDAARKRFEPRALNALSERAFYAVLTEMLGTLKQSHFALIPPETFLAQEAAQGKSFGGVVGMTVALGFDNQLLVTRVVPNGAAQAAGLRPGLVVTHIDNKPVDETVIRPVTARNLRPAETRLQARLAAETLLGGPVGGVLRVGYRDEAGQTRTAEITRRAPQGEPVRFGQLPPLYTEFEVRRLDNNSVGYIRFNPFLVPLLEPVKKAVRDLKSQNVRGIILDLRGNHGGVGAMAYGVANSFATKQGTLGTMRMRQGQANFPVFPAPDAFTGPLVILTDEASLSTSEILAGGLQEMGRATIVGRPTGGMVLPSFVERLPGGARLQYAIADFKTPKGVLLEGQGVLPDVPVPLRASELVGGRDPDIEVALAQIRGQQPPPGGAPAAATR